MHVGRGGFLGMAIFVSCASGPDLPPSNPLWKDGVMQKPLTPEDAVRYINKAEPQLAVCYRREAMNISLDQKLSDYVFQIWIPPDGSETEVELVSETVSGQKALYGCVEDVLGNINFPAHVGEAMTLKVPIEGPR